MSKDLDKLLKQLSDLHPKYIDLSLDRLKLLLEKIGNPHLKLPPVIHIAGTNGKGSTLSYLRYILMENKLKVHAYISPHLKIFNERIILANDEIKTQKLIKTLEFIKKINNKNPITFFEITTAAAFYLFSNQKADFLILETGLGGRLDATNIIKNSFIDIITPIGIDHQEFLGNSILKITNEKLGIIKKNSSVIISKQNKIVSSHIKKKLNILKNDSLFFDKDFKITKKNNKNFVLQYKKINFVCDTPNLIGEHQIENASTAIATILRLNELGQFISHKNIRNGIKKTRWPGRLEQGVLENIKVYLDGAHNIDGATQLSKYFKNKKIKAWLILGMLNNKNLYEYLKKLKPIIKGIIAISIPDQDNSFTTNQIINICNKLEIKNYPAQNIYEANNLLLKEIRPKVIIITGSLYLIGKIRNIYL